MACELGELLIILVVLTMTWCSQKIAGQPHDDYPSYAEIPVNNMLLHNIGMYNGVYSFDYVHGVALKLCQRLNVDWKKVCLPPLVIVLQSKLKRMAYLLRNCKGGRAIQKLKQKWRNSSYDLKFLYKTFSLIKRKLELNLHEEDKRRKVCEEKLQKAKHSLIDITRKKEKAEKDLQMMKQKDVASIENSASSRKEYSSSHLRRLQAKKVQIVKENIESLKDNSFSPVSFKIAGANGKVKEVFFSNYDNEGSADDMSSDFIDEIIYVRDTCNISRKAYHELAQRTNKLPIEHNLASRKKSLNNIFSINEVGGDYVGVWQSIKEHMVKHLEFKSREGEGLGNIVEGNRIRIKVSGDGTKFGKIMHVMNFTYTIIGEHGCSWQEGNYLIGIG